MGKPAFSKVTLMIPPPRPDRSTSEERRLLKATIRENSLKATIDAMVDGYYQWENDPDPLSARRKKRATLIFSKDEIKRLVPMEIYSLLGNLDFLEDTLEQNREELPK